MTEEQQQVKEEIDVLDDIFGPADVSEPDPTPEPASKPVVRKEEDSNANTEEKDIEDEEEEAKEAQREAEYQDEEGETGEGELEDGDEYITQDDYDTLVEQNKQLLERLNGMGNTMQQSGGFPGIQGQVQAQQAQQAQAPPGQQQSQQGQPFNVEQYLLKPDELDRVLDDPKLINQAIQRANEGMLSHVQNTVGNVNQVVQEQIQQTLWAKEVSDNFFSRNKDLQDSNLRQYVTMVAGNMIQQAASMGQNIELDKTLDNAAGDVRKSLGMKMPRRRTVSKGKRAHKPARKASFAGASSGRGKSGQAASRTRQQQVIDSVLDL